jgi:hypothetical protein
VRDRFLKIKEMDRFLKIKEMDKFQNIKEKTTFDQIYQSRNFKLEIDLNQVLPNLSEDSKNHSTTLFKISSDHKLAPTNKEDNLKILAPTGNMSPAQQMQHSSSWLSSLLHDVRSYIPYFCSQYGKKKNEEIFIKKNK